MTEREKMMKEALEWQEHIRKLVTSTNDELYFKRSKVFDWLVRQAKRVEELEKRIENLNELTDMQHEQNIRSHKQLNQLIRTNQRYKQALEEIRGLYPLRNIGYKVSEIKKIVVQALEVTEK